MSERLKRIRIRYFFLAVPLLGAIIGINLSDTPNQLSIQEGPTPPQPLLEPSLATQQPISSEGNIVFVPQSIPTAPTTPTP